jgi:hypothetical protein
MTANCMDAWCSQFHRTGNPDAGVAQFAEKSDRPVLDDAGKEQPEAGVEETGQKGTFQVVIPDLPGWGIGFIVITHGEHELRGRTPGTTQTKASPPDRQTPIESLPSPVKDLHMS